MVIEVTDEFKVEVELYQEWSLLLERLTVEVKASVAVKLQRAELRITRRMWCSGNVYEENPYVTVQPSQLLSNPTSQQPKTNTHKCVLCKSEWVRSITITHYLRLQMEGCDGHAGLWSSETPPHPHASPPQHTNTHQSMQNHHTLIQLPLRIQFPVESSANRLIELSTHSLCAHWLTALRNWARRQRAVQIWPPPCQTDFSHQFLSAMCSLDIVLSYL